MQLDILLWLDESHYVVSREKWCMNTTFCSSFRHGKKNSTDVAKFKNKDCVMREYIPKRIYP